MKPDKILLDHGSGGKLSQQLIKANILPAFDNSLLAQMDDGAVFRLGDSALAFSTDTFVVDPIFFPGGNIGDLAINGTVNDLAMCGAEPCYLSSALIIEEGFEMALLAKIIQSMRQAADCAGVRIVTGDTKVVPKGAADKLFINTAGIGKIIDDTHVSGRNAKPGDKIILSGTIGDHGAAVLTKREGLAFDAAIESDTACLNHLVCRMFKTTKNIHVLRDPTRGGLGTTLNEIASQSRCGIRIYEERLPVKPAVAGVCELLGVDPIYLANEGKLLACVEKSDADQLLSIMNTDPLGGDACIIGEVVADLPGKVRMVTHIGGERFVDMLTGEQLPRIC